MCTAHSRRGLGLISHTSSGHILYLICIQRISLAAQEPRSRPSSPHASLKTSLQSNEIMSVTAFVPLCDMCHNCEQRGISASRFCHKGYTKSDLIPGTHLQPLRISFERRCRHLIHSARNLFYSLSRRDNERGRRTAEKKATAKKPFCGRALGI